MPVLPIDDTIAEIIVLAAAAILWSDAAVTLLRIGFAHFGW